VYGDQDFDKGKRFCRLVVLIDYLFYRLCPLRVKPIDNPFFFLCFRLLYRFQVLTKSQSGYKNKQIQSDYSVYENKHHIESNSLGSFYFIVEVI